MFSYATNSSWISWFPLPQWKKKAEGFTGTPHDASLIDRINMIRCDFPSQDDSRFDLSQRAKKLDEDLRRVIRCLQFHPRVSSLKVLSHVITSLEAKLSSSLEFRDPNQSSNFYEECAKKVEEALKNIDEALTNPLEKPIEITEQDELGGSYKTKCQTMYKHGKKYLKPINQVVVKSPRSLTSENYPSKVSTSEAYITLFKRCHEQKEKFSGSLVDHLLNSPALNVPSDLEIETRSGEQITISNASFVDIPRLLSFTVNGVVVFDKEYLLNKRKTQEVDISHLYKKCLKALDNDVKLADNLFKLSTQAVVAGLTVGLTQKLTNNYLGIHLSGGGLSIEVEKQMSEKELKDAGLNVLSSEYPILKLRYIVNYTLCKLTEDGEKEVLKYIKGIREIFIARDWLRQGIGKESIIFDSMIPLDSPTTKNLMQKELGPVKAAPQQLPPQQQLRRRIVRT